MVLSVCSTPKSGKFWKSEFPCVVRATKQDSRRACSNRVGSIHELARLLFFPTDIQSCGASCASLNALARNWVVHFGVITTLPLTSIFCVLLTMMSILEDFNSTVIMLTAAAECCDSHEQTTSFLLTKAEETYQRLRLVWPQPNGMKPCLPVYDSCPLANEYYMHSIPNNGLHFSNDRTNHGVRVLFLA